MIRVPWSRAGLRTRIRVAYLLVALVGLVGIVSVVVTFDQVVDTREHLADRLDPAGFETRRWVSAFVDQESGVRGFALSGDETFLEPYDQGVRTAAAAERRARAFLADEPDLLRLADRFTREAEAWRAGPAAGLVVSTRSSGPASASDDELAESKASFDGVRVTYRALQDALDARRAEVRARLDDHTTDLARSAIVAVLLAAFGLFANWIALNRWVVRPVASLAADAQRVAAGDLQHPIAGAGPPDLQGLAADMEAMRRGILGELEAVEASRRRFEQQAVDLGRSNQELEQFAYVASHDLQEPLRKITGFCQLLQRRYGGQLDERADEYIAFAVDGAKRMQVLINDLLSFSRVGRTTERFAPVDLQAVAEAARATLDDVIAEAGATIALGPLPTVEGDASLLEALFQNLLGNAVKFRGDDPPLVSITARPAGDGDGWELACTDNGIGIEADYAERVFVIFQRLNGRDAFEGTGIGLAMCRKIVEFHGGRIWVDTHPTGQGTVVRWTMPTHVPRLPDEVTPAARPTPAPAQEPS